jgi:hypothetical protein
MVRQSRRAGKPGSTSTTNADDIIQAIAALPERERQRLGYMLAKQSRTSATLLPRYAVLLMADADLLLTLARDFTERAVAYKQLLDKVMPVAEELCELTGVLLKTRQRKRGPGRQGATELRTIARMKSGGSSRNRGDWTAKTSAGRLPALSSAGSGTSDALPNSAAGMSIAPTTSPACCACPA